MSSPATATRAGGYWVVDRFWEDGDELRVHLPMSLHLHPMPDDDTLQAVMYGPLVLAGDLGREGVTDATAARRRQPSEYAQACAGAGFRGGVERSAVVDRAGCSSAHVPH